MERREQLSNVAFGGDWSEAVAPREEAQSALRALWEAVNLCHEEDPAQYADALWTATQGRNKGQELYQAYMRASRIEHPSLRENELRRVVGIIEAQVGAAR